MTTPPVDDDLIREVLVALVGQSVRLEFHEKDQNSPMNLLLDHATHILETNALVYWSHGGPPQTLALEEFSQPVVLFSPRLVEVWADFRAIFAEDRLDEGLKASKIEQVLLRIMGEVAIVRTDDPALPVQLAMEACRMSPKVFIAPNDLTSLEHTDIGLAYMNCWFFGLAHELGHFVPEELAARHHGAAEELLIQAIDAFDSVDQKLRDRVIDRVRGRSASSVLDVGQICIEAQADGAAMIVLFESTIDILKQLNRLEQFSLGGFYQEMILSLNVVATLGQIEDVVATKHEGVDDYEISLDQAFLRCAVETRAKLAFEMLTNFISQKYPNAEELTQENQLRLVSERASAMQSDILAWDRGVSDAMNTLFSLTVPTDLGSFVDRLNETPSDAYDLRHVLDRAHRAGRSSWAFDLVERRLSDQQRPIELEELEPKGDPYFYLCLGDEAKPLCIRIGASEVCFVFTNQDFLRAFAEDVARILENSYRVTSTMTLADRPSTVIDVVEARLRPRTAPHVVIEGSKDFDEAMTALIRREVPIGVVLLE